jgi:predicted ATPase/DNA-binding SARP family transcriptional activator
MIRVLGPLEVEVDGAVVPLGSARQRALLAVLVLHANEVVSTDQVAEAIWGEALPEGLRNAVQTHVARLRRALGPAGRALVTRPPGYLYVVEEDQLDAARFDRLVVAARARLTAEPAAAAALLDEALGCWRGAAYAEFADGFARPAAVRLEALRSAAELDRAAAALRLGHVDEAVARAEDRVAVDPLDERSVELLIRALHAAGRPADALAALRRHRDRLVEELGLDPSPRLVDLEQRLLRDELPRGAAPEPAALVAPDTAIATAVPVAIPPLPRRPDPLIGRGDLLAAVDRDLADGGLVTLTGPGGIGKTRLALEVAHRAAAARTTWWVDLATVDDPATIVTAIGPAVGLELPPDPDARQLARALAARSGVLVLDNAEHLLDALAPLLDTLVGLAPALTVLVTSRERVAVAGECVHVLRPLPTAPEEGGSVSPAVALFLDRSATLDREDLVGAVAGQVADLCRRLDGLPLAIELAAARVDVLGLGEVLARLDDRLDVLGGGPRTAAARHRTLRAVIDWSHELLRADEQVLFRRLAVFPGSFSLGQVERVCADDGAIPTPACADVLARLIERSLVQTGDGRFALLETLRAYAAERLAGEEADPDAVRRRHAEDTLRRAEELTEALWGPDEAVTVRRFTELLSDLRAAWALARDTDADLAVAVAASVHDLAYHRQRFDLLAWGDEIAARSDAAGPRLPRALAAATALAWARGDLDVAARHAARGVAAAADRELGAALELQADVHMLRGDTDAAVRAYDRAAAVRHGLGRIPEELVVRASAAAALAYAGRSEEASARLVGLVATARGCDNPTARAYVAYAVGEVVADADPARALAALDEAIAWAEPVDGRLVLGVARSAAVALHARVGDPATALARFGAVLDHWERTGNDVLQWTLLRNLVVLLARTQHDDAAARLGGAVAGRSPKPDYGVEAERVAAALEAVRGRLGPDAYRRSWSAGRAWTLAAAVAFAREVLAANAGAPG